MRLLLFLAAALAQAQDATSLSWFAGCWEMKTASGTVVEEQWTKPAGGTLLGMGRTIRGGKTVFTEFQSIGPVEGKLTYTARIGTPGVTLFPLLRMTADEIVFENPTHDFPQRIVYRKREGGLFARIEGVDKGKPRSQDFPYQRAACEAR